jgi:hypothetical protein
VIPEHAARQSSQLDPETSWTVVTEAPLKGLGLAREAGTILAWDETDQLYLIDLRGNYRSVSRAPGKVVSAAISDDGTRIVLLGDRGRVWMLDADLRVVSDRQGPPEPLALAIDPHGRYVLVTSKIGFAQFYNRHGKPAGKFETTQALAFVAFIPDRPILLGAAAYGSLSALDLSEAGSEKLSAEVDWEDRQIGGVGRLTTTGDGSMVLASCFTHGVQRYDLHGHNEGSYHLGGTAVHAVPDFAGRMIAVASLEGELSLLNSGGNVRWKTGLPRPVNALEVDPLGRYLIYGHDTGGSSGSTFTAPTPRSLPHRSRRPASDRLPARGCAPPRSRSEPLTGRFRSRATTSRPSRPCSLCWMTRRGSVCSPPTSGSSCSPRAARTSATLRRSSGSGGS